jgi:hypothetical protein
MPNETKLETISKLRKYVCMYTDITYTHTLLKELWRPKSHATRISSSNDLEFTAVPSFGLGTLGLDS